MKENVFEIGKAVQNHFDLERKYNVQNYAIARLLCTYESSNEKVSEVKSFWLTNSENKRNSLLQRDITGAVITTVSTNRLHTLISDGQPVYKNTRLGDILTKYYNGTHSYSLLTKLKRVNNINLTIHNKAVYVPTPASIQEVLIRIADDELEYRYQRLSDLLEARRSLEEKLELQKHEEEQLRKKREELETQQRATEEAKRIKEEIKETERKLQEKEFEINTVRSFIRENVSLRSQHLLDEYQETAKRSHLYDGVPIIIDGGPGTGKTTTMIQRLKFLLSEEALIDYDVPLSKEQLEFLTNEKQWNNNWLFFSPTTLLLAYLRNNMNEEGLSAGDNNTITIDTFRKNMMREYRLHNPETDGPFKVYKVKSEDENRIILYPQTAIENFEKFCVNNIKAILKNAYDLKTSDYAWHSLAVRIKSYCKRAENIKDIEALMRLFNSLFDNERKEVIANEQLLGEQLKNETAKIKLQIGQNEECVNEIKELFEKWYKEKEFNSDEVDENEMEQEDEEEQISQRLDYDAKLFSTLRGLLKNMALKTIDSKQKISKRQNELLSILTKCGFVELFELKEIAELAWFVKNYAFLCRGITSNILSQLPRLYKLYRKKQVEVDNGIYKKNLLEKLIKKDSNKHLHPDEICLLIGFINNLLLNIYKKSKNRFESLKHNYAIAYRNSVKPVIGVDEATDYTLLDYYMIYSFRHYDISSVTLCGDIMQGLNKDGISDWQELKTFVMPNVEINELNISYRQLPTLLNVAREMYKDDQSAYPSYHTCHKPTDKEPAPIVCVSDDEEEKTKWIAKRIVEVYEAYGHRMPSVAIFVGEDEDIDDFIEQINDLDILNSIDVADCSGGKMIGRKDTVRVFRLSEVKGMEFEVVFFHNIDKVIQVGDFNLMRRYLYVGISRATSHLAATFCSEKGNENVLKYFDRTIDNWGL